MDEAKKSGMQFGSAPHLIIGIITSLVIVALSWTHFYQDQEASIYDTRFRIRNDTVGEPLQSPYVSTIDIDDLALQSYGWPLTRDRHAALVNILSKYESSMIGFDIFFYEPAQTLLSPEDVASVEKETLTKEEVIQLIKDHDQDFLKSIRESDIVFLPQTFEIAEKGFAFAADNLRKRGADKDAALKALSKSFTPLPSDLSPNIFHTIDMDVPLLSFIEAAKGIGFALPQPDHDGIVRRYRLALAYDGHVFYSLSLMMACDFLQVPIQNVIFVPGKLVRLPNARLPDGTVTDINIPVSSKGEMLVNWAGAYHDTFKHMPYNLIIDFADTEPGNRSLKIAKRIAAENPNLLNDDQAYLEMALQKGGEDLSPDVLLEMKYLVSDCIAIEQALVTDLELTVETYATNFAAAVGIPEEEVPSVVEVLAGSFNRIKNNLKIYRILKENSGLSLQQVASQMGVTRLEEVKLGVGIIRDLIRRGGIGPEDHPLFFLDRITSAGLQGDEATDRIVTTDNFKKMVFFYGLTATGTHDLNPTPFGAREAMLGVHVNVFNTIITQNFLDRIPQWANVVIMLVLGILVGILIPRFKALPGAGVIIALLAIFVVGAFAAFIKLGYWIDILGPVATLVMGYLTITIYDYVQKEKEKEFVQGAFGHYLDPQVIDQLVENPEQLGQLGGDQRVMTAFFSDVASFSTIAESLTPIELVELLNEYLSAMCDIIGDMGGTIDKFEGDAIIAFYGAPLKTDDHAVKSVLAAVDMQAKIIELRDNWEETGKMVELRQMWAEQGRGDFFRVRMGINTGEMVVGNLGSNTRVDYTIMGDSVNLAARLEGAGKAYDVTTMISETTYRAAGREVIDVRELDSLRVVGRDEPVRVYEILGRSGEVDGKKMEVVEMYQAGLGLYKERKWTEAISTFESGLQIDPLEGPCRVFIDRCQEYMQAPPPEDWDAVHVLDSK
jgi:class 3 adenylate cyclase/CHASE2 domain-containing sensor protein